MNRQYNTALTACDILFVCMVLNLGGSLKVFIPRSMYRSFPTRPLTSCKIKCNKHLVTEFYLHIFIP